MVGGSRSVRHTPDLTHRFKKRLALELLSIVATNILNEDSPAKLAVHANSMLQHSSKTIRGPIPSRGRHYPPFPTVLIKATH